MAWIRTHPHRGEGYAVLGNYFFQAQHWTAALRAYQKSLSLNFKTPELCIQIGQVYEELGQRDRTIEFYEAALKIDKTLAEIAYRLAQLYLQKGDSDRALDRCDRALQQDKQVVSANFYAKLGKQFSEQSLLQKALLCFQRCFQCQPHYESAMNLAILYRKLGDLKNAQFYIDRSISMNPNYSWSHFTRGNLLLQLKRYDEALESYHNVLKLYPTRLEAYNGCTVACLRQGQWEQALSYCLRSLSIRQNQPSVYQKIASIFKQQNQNQLALRCEKGDLPDFLKRRIQEFNQNYWHQPNSSDSYHWQSVISPKVVRLKYPKTIESQAHSAFNVETRYLPENFILSIPNGKVFYNFDITVLTSDNRVISAVSSNLANLEKAVETRLQRYPGRLVFIPQRQSENYFHWTFDTLTRLALLQKAGFQWQPQDRLVVNPLKYPFQKESLAKMGITSDQIISIDSFYFQAEAAIVPTLLGDTHTIPTDWMCQFIRQSFLPNPCPSPHQRIYIQRGNAKFRRVLNEEEVINALAKYGFVPVALETLSLEEQAATLASAEAVVAPHGAGNTNIVYCQPGTPFIEIFAPNYVEDFYWLIAEASKLPYFYLLGDDPQRYYRQRDRNPPQYFRPNCQDILVNCDRLTASLELAGIHPRSRND